MPLGKGCAALMVSARLTRRLKMSASDAKRHCVTPAAAGLQVTFMVAAALIVVALAVGLASRAIPA